MVEMQHLFLSEGPPGTRVESVQVLVVRTGRVVLGDDRVIVDRGERRDSIRVRRLQLTPPEQHVRERRCRTGFGERSAIRKRGRG